MRRNGFTLIELAIVIAILTIIAAITIPNLLQARMNSNEIEAVRTLRVLADAEARFFAKEGRYGTLPELFERAFADKDLERVREQFITLETNPEGIARRSGYYFIAYPKDDESMTEDWLVYAWPVIPENTGTWSYCIYPSDAMRRCERGGDKNQPPPLALAAYGDDWESTNGPE